MIESRFTKSINNRNLLGLSIAITLALAIALSIDNSTQVVNAQSRSIQSTSEIRSSGVISLYLPLIANTNAIRPSSVFSIYLPLVFKSLVCPTLSNETYGTVAPMPPPTDRPAEIHADLNLAMRGYISTTAFLSLVDYGGATDLNAPQLPGLFANNRTPTFRQNYRVYDWDWACNCKSTPITDWDVTLAGLLVTPTETIRVPASGYDIGKLPNGYSVMVLYASTNRITLTYTRNDNVIQGYTIHIENICVEPRLLTLYQTMNAAGRTQLPALYAGQGIGTAISNELGVAIRDTGSFMDPRSRKDWWQGR